MTEMSVQEPAAPLQQPEEWAYWLALLRAPGVGPLAFARFLERFPGPRQVFETSRAEWEALGVKSTLIQYLQAPDWQTVEQDLRWLEAPGHYLLTLHDPLYPAHLRTIHDPPPLLFIDGDPALLETPQIAMVGARNPSRGGEDTAAEFAKDLSVLGLTVTSGLAYGIDAASHQGALEGSGKTLAILGTGADIIYPAKHRQLAARIAEGGGALVSEWLPGTPARGGHFPRRNRIISGLSLGTLVVEASLRSGSLITARLAAEQGREVFAIPGSIHNPLAKGCHALLKEGAKLVETVEDVIEELRIFRPVDKDTVQAELPIEIDLGLDEEYQRLLDYMGIDAPLTVDTLVESCGLTAETVSSMLLILELRGLVAAQPGGRYVRLVQRNL